MIGGSASLPRKELFSPGSANDIDTDGSVTDLTVKGGSSSGGEGAPLKSAPEAKVESGSAVDSSPVGAVKPPAEPSFTPTRDGKPNSASAGAAAEPKSPAGAEAKPLAPAVPEKPKTDAKANPKPEPGNPSSQCTTTYFRNDNDWSPGLPFKKASAPRLTYGDAVVAWNPSATSVTENQNEEVRTGKAGAKAKDQDKAKAKDAKKTNGKPKTEAAKKPLKTVGLGEDASGDDDDEGGHGVMLAAASSGKAAKKADAKKKAGAKAPPKGAKRDAKTIDNPGNAGSKTTGKNEVLLQYTDAAVDGLLNVAFEKNAALPKFMQATSKQLAKSIVDVKLHTDMVSGESKMEFVFEAENSGSRIPVLLKGHVIGTGKYRMDSELTQAVTAPQKAQFSALVSCDDVLRGCKNVLIRLQQLNSGGKIIRVAYIVHRQGPVHVTIAKKDSRVDATKTSAHKQFVTLLLNTAQNACLNILELAGLRKEEERRDLGACMMERKEAQCGKSGRPTSGVSADDFVLRTWSVVQGKAGFEWIAAKKKVSTLLDYENQSYVAFSISGPLARSSRRPMIPKHLVSYKSPDANLKDLVTRVLVVANDGGGNLNLQVSFKGEEAPNTNFTRVSLTSLFSDHKVQDNTIDEIRQMPDIAADRFADKEEPGDAEVVAGN